jgi:amino acid transporter
MVTAGQSRGNSLTTGRVVFLVIAAASPMAGAIGNVPLALVYGNGAGLPVAFAIACVVLLCFSVGYAAMSRRVVNTGAFYTYVAVGIGRAPAVGAAYLAVLSYTALTIGLAGAFGYFVRLVLLTQNISVAWQFPAAVALLLVAILGYRSVALSAKVVGVLMIAELIAVVVMNAGIIFHKGLAAALPSASLSPHEALSGSIGIGLMFAFTSFVGFESAALYGEETADPQRSVPRATYIALTVIGIFLFFTAWLIVGAIGVSNTHQVASRELGNLLFDVAATNVGTTLRDVMAVLLCTSVLASMLAIHNAASRYLFALGRERVLPAALGNYHIRHLSPHIASVTVSVISTVVVAAFAVGGLDPYVTLAASMIGLSTLGVVLLQVLAAISVVAFFLRRREGSYLRTVVIPAVGAVGLVVAFVLATAYFPTLVGTTNPIIGNLPWLLGAVVVAGYAAGSWQRRGQAAVHRQPANSGPDRRYDGPDPRYGGQWADGRSQSAYAANPAGNRHASFREGGS